MTLLLKMGVFEAIMIGDSSIMISYMKNDNPPKGLCLNEYITIILGGRTQRPFLQRVDGSQLVESMS